MLDTQIKILASLYTAILISAMVSLLIFGDYTFKSPVVKGKVIQAMMVDISQLKALTKPSKKPTLKKVEKKPKKVIKEKPKPIQEPKVIKPKIRTPKIDTKALERERRQQQDRERRKKELQRKKQENQKKLEQAKQDLEDLAQREPDERPTITDIGNTKGKPTNDKIAQLLVLWQTAVRSAVYRQWSSPASTKKNMKCHVKVRQIPGGAVMSAVVVPPCNANSEVKKSIIAAIMKAEPLPYQGFEEVFDRNAVFIFESQ